MKQHSKRTAWARTRRTRKAIAAKLFAIERQSLYDAIKSAPDILFICAAGNADSNSSFNEMIPSSFKLPNLLTVGAVDQAGDEASFTSYGETVLVDANGCTRWSPRCPVATRFAFPVRRWRRRTR